MSNLFKQNSRFSSLIDFREINDDIVNKKNTSKPAFTKNQNQNIRTIQHNNSFNKKNIEQHFSFDESNFPELITKTNALSISDNAYIEHLKKEKEKEECNDANNEKTIVLQSGWILLKKEAKTYMYNCPENKYLHTVVLEDDSVNIINTLVKLHEMRTKEYIDLYGYDIWENMFKFPNWETIEKENEYDTDTDNDVENDSDTCYEYDSDVNYDV